MDDFKNLTEVKTDSQEIFDGVILHVFKDTVQLPNGHPATREVIRHVGAVGVIPITDDGKVIIERQFRYPLDRVITEIPAGKLESKSEDRLEAAKRELKEETGLEASEWVKLADVTPAAAYTDEVISVYLARGLTMGEAHPDEDEFLNVIKMPLDELCEWAATGKLNDSKTLCGLLLAKRYIGG